MISKADRRNTKGLNLPSSVKLAQGRGGLPVLKVSAAGGTGEIYLQGAHLAEWAPTGHSQVLWMSKSSRFETGQPIRGGIPICFPWFGAHPSDPQAPMHGFARIQPWILVDVYESADDVTAVLRLTDSPVSRMSCWPFRFEAEYAVTIGRELRLSLTVQNCDTVGFTFEESLHTYYAVGNVNATRVTRTDSAENTVMLATADAASVSSMEEISEIHHGVQATAIVDTVHNRTVDVSTKDSGNSIIWNPGRAKALANSDFDREGWRHMLCYEACNIKESAVRLQPGATHRMVVTMSVQGASLVSDGPMTIEKDHDSAKHQPENFTVTKEKR